MGLVESNPTIGSPGPSAAEPRDRVLSDDELVAIWNACGNDHYGKIIRLLTLTGCRRREIGDVAWSEFDLDRGVWTLPAERSKNGRSHTLPILPAMRQILDTVPNVVGRDQLFGGCSHGLTTWAEGKKALDARLGDRVKPWCLRDLRRTAATRMCDIGVPPHVVEQILNHQSGHRAGVAGVYNKSPYEREVRSALALWHDHIRMLVEGGERKVLPYPQGAA
jgi:integrase